MTIDESVDREERSPKMRRARSEKAEDRTSEESGSKKRFRAGAEAAKGEWKRTFFILLGLVLFAIVYLSPTPPEAVDPQGEVFGLSREGKAALALFFLAATWWVTPVTCAPVLTTLSMPIVTWFPMVAMYVPALTI